MQKHDIHYTQRHNNLFTMLKNLVNLICLTIYLVKYPNMESSVVCVCVREYVCRYYLPTYSSMNITFFAAIFVIYMVHIQLFFIFINKIVYNVYTIIYNVI